MRTLTEALDQRVLLADGSATRFIKDQRLDIKRDLYGAGDCFDVLNLTRPRLVRDMHVAYLDAGADIVRTHTQQASPLTLQRFGLSEEAFYINYSAAQNACKAVDSVPGRGRRRFVLGVVNDDGWLATSEIVERAVAIQVEGLLAGGVDGVAIDVTRGPGRAGIILRASRKTRTRLRSNAPIFLQRSCTTPALCGPTNPLADAVICCYRDLAEGSESLQTMIRAHQINLVDGGSSPAETVALDKRLRELAEDNLRPVTQWYQHTAVDEVEPASSTLYIDAPFAKVS
jgi:glutathione S-transferase